MTQGKLPGNAFALRDSASVCGLSAETSPLREHYFLATRTAVVLASSAQPRLCINGNSRISSTRVGELRNKGVKAPPTFDEGAFAP